MAVSDTSPDKSDSKAGAWTEEAKYQFLLRVVAQLKEDGKSINWSRINMPGRTTKSLQNMWTKINKSVSELEEAQDGKSPAKPKKLSTPRSTLSKKRNRESFAERSGDDLDEKPFKKPSKDIEPSPRKSVKKEKAEDCPGSFGTFDASNEA
ncbi:hypothetical protein S40285_00946 [Stachybotrys chlorohalonatus IBT 40285]|uniref:Myb-like domain-containing protein n=1 Tax=Stachybotrys chlorohalonatus (strain IBT 40285) TaxID=1283841 RepID=A0A084QUW5_STAC4|nr:hypothetical protein S40285_00946 [Stachybotrys chlorohalonata IBT 40285]